MELGTNTPGNEEGVVTSTTTHGGSVERNGQPQGVIALLAVDNGAIRISGEIDGVVASAKVDNVTGLSPKDVVFARRAEKESEPVLPIRVLAESVPVMEL